jgi:dihydropyrimidinase
VTELLITGGTVVSPRGTERADVLVRDGLIVGVGADAVSDDARRIDASGLLVLPGVVDEHVHPIYLDDPRATSIVAAHGGVTTVMHFAYAPPGRSLVEAVESLRAQARDGVLDFAIHAGMFDPASQASEMAAVVARGIRTFKVFLAYAAQGWMTDDRCLVDVLRRAAALDALVMVHCENGAAIDALEADARAGRFGADPVDALLASRPAVLEAEATHRALALAEAFAADVFIVHVTCERALEVVRAARVRGQRAVAETCPQYLALTSEELRTRGALAKIGPPLRTARDAEALWEGIVDGTLQCVGSDHVPKKRADEASAPLFDAGFGAPSTETMLPVLYDEGVVQGRITLERMVEVLSENPARVFGLFPRKGVVAPGADADIVLWHPRVKRRLGADQEHTASGYSLYEGREVTGAPVLVMASGRVIVRDGELVDDRPRGRFLETGPFDLLTAATSPCPDG